MPIKYGRRKKPKKGRDSSGKLSPSARGYDRTWRKFSEDHRDRMPLCGESENKPRESEYGCLSKGLVRPATEVDHIIPLSEGGARLDPQNTQSLCSRCHLNKTARERYRAAFRGGST